MIFFYRNFNDICLPVLHWVTRKCARFGIDYYYYYCCCLYRLEHESAYKRTSADIERTTHIINMSMFRCLRMTSYCLCNNYLSCVVIMQFRTLVNELRMKHHRSSIRAPSAKQLTIQPFEISE